jgi:hypothetical protein
MKIIYFIIVLIIFIIFNKYKNECNSDIKLLNLKEMNYNSDIKTCILISGQVRDNFYQCIQSQKIFIFDPLKVDIFAVFSDDASDDIKDYVIKLLKPKGILWIKDNNYYNDYLSIPKSSYNMTYKILLCNNLKKKYENENNFKYDINIRTRIDLIIKSYIPENIINNIEDNTIYYPSLGAFDIMNNSILGIVDQFLIGNSYSMNIFSNIYNYINKSRNNETDIIEIFIKNYLLNNNIKIKKIKNFKFFLTKFLIDNKNIIDICKQSYSDPNKNHKILLNYLNIFNYLEIFNY